MQQELAEGSSSKWPVLTTRMTLTCTVIILDMDAPPCFPSRIGSSILWYLVSPSERNLFGGGLVRTVTTPPLETYDAKRLEAPRTYVDYSFFDFRGLRQA
jgi:hypothetical protein